MPFGIGMEMEILAQAPNDKKAQAPNDKDSQPNDTSERH